MSKEAPTIIGPDLFAVNERGRLVSRVGTCFPAQNVIITEGGIHAAQRSRMVDILNRRRKDQALSPLTHDEENDLWNNAVDLVMDVGTVLIRPNPERMDLAFLADEMLQWLVPKRHIRFLNVYHLKVRQAIKARGECWRIAAVPQTENDKVRMIYDSRVSIGGESIYYYNRATGTRLITCQDFAALDAYNDEKLKKHLIEIRKHAMLTNSFGYPEVAFFMAGEAFKADFFHCDIHALEGAALREMYHTLRDRFLHLVPEECRTGGVENPSWLRRIFAALIAPGDDLVAEEALSGLSSEFFLQIEWLPGGEIRNGRLILDSIAKEFFQSCTIRPDADTQPRNACELIFNFLREYGDIEYINIGRVVQSLATKKRPLLPGRRDVYVAQYRRQGDAREWVEMIRMQKRGVREHLDEGEDLLEAVALSAEYTESILDRWLGCRQLGMQLPSRLTTATINEIYLGENASYHNQTIRSAYCKRDYIAGLATDKISTGRFEDDDFALRFARLLGQAAASNMIVGRGMVDPREGRFVVIFDDGDEILVEDDRGLPRHILVADPTGAFRDFETPLEEIAPRYAAPIVSRLPFVSAREEFIAAYLEGFLERFVEIQKEYVESPHVLDLLFRHRSDDTDECFVCRWESILKRLLGSDPHRLAHVIRQEIAKGENDDGYAGLA